jgi:iron complex outermembrane receptor protein|tara:strand:- start:6799 stop:9339 length:2541 start_codon:yes stop_codon:yes gene_type:complete
MSFKHTITAGFKLSPLATAFLLMGNMYTVNAAEVMAENTSTKGIEVIEVTSTKRSTSLMETGQAISAFNEGLIEELAIKGAQDLVKYSPSLIVTNSKVSIRGIGRPNNALGSDPGVGIYTDGVYNTENGVFSYCNFCDIERIEVLRGPQGTLYGRNAVGGAINFISKAPQADFGGYVNLEAGNDGYLLTQGQITGALTDTFSAIVTVSKKERDALQENLAEGVTDFDNVDRTYFSGTLKADWNESWTSSLRYINTDRSQNPSPGYLKDQYSTDYIGFGIDNLPGMFPGAAALNHLSGYTLANPAVNDISQTSVDTAGHLDSQTERFIFINTVTMGDIDMKYTFGSYDLEYDRLTDGDVSNKAFGGMDLSMMYAEFTSVFLQNPYYFPNPVTDAPITLSSDMTASTIQTGDTQSHELQFISNYDGDFNFIAGLYSYNSKESQYTDFVERGFGLMQGDAISANYGGALTSGTYFGQDAMSLYQLYALGVSYSAGIPVEYIPFEKAGDDGGYIYYGQNELETTSTAIYGQVEYQLNDELLLTGGLRYSKDEKEGSDDVFVYLALPNTQHQVKDDWSKITWRIQADWQVDQDTFLYGYVATGFRSGGFNLGGATSENPNSVNPEELTAFEVGYKKSMFDSRVNLSLAAYYYDYTDMQVRSAKIENGITTSVLDNAAEATVSGIEAELQALVMDDLYITAMYSYNNSQYDEYMAEDSIACTILGECGVKDLSGNQLNMAPETKYSLSATQYFDFNDMGSIALTASYSYVGEQFSRAFNRDDWDKVDSYNSVDGRLAWTSPEESFVVAAFVKNASDERNVLLNSTPAPETRMQATELSDPILYGIQVRYNFY